MNYHDIKHCNMVNGEGLRTVIWVSGCSHNCPGCFNPETHDPNSGIPFDDAAKEEFLRDLKTDWCAGVTFSGGDPLNHNNFDTVYELCKEIKTYYPSKTIWLYTGYIWDDIISDDYRFKIINYIDVIIDGPFILSQKSLESEWVGSSNQHIIRVKDRLEKINRITTSK